jgi:hypothetical protein
MRYKVWMRDTTRDAGGSFAFYTRAQAVSFCEGFVNFSPTAQCFLWDGSVWTEYAPVP